MLKKELLFFEWDSFGIYKEQVLSQGYSIISISDFLKDITDDSLYFSIDTSNTIVDISVLASGYTDCQALGERILDKFSEFETIFIADKRFENRFVKELRYRFLQFNDIKIILPPATGDKVIGDSHKSNIKSHKRITDLTDVEIEDFLSKFRGQLYGHEKFKDEFHELIKNFKVFNKLGEHKVLSLFLMGESGVGKTEVAKTIYNCLGGEKGLAKINFGNYSSDFSLSSLIGSARGYTGSDDGEIFIRVRNTDVGVILIDEFEKSTATLFNYFLDVLESGKIISSQEEEIDINGFIIVFTSNISKENFASRISPELRSRFDYKGMFTRLYSEDKKKYVEFRLTSITKKYNDCFDDKLPDNLYNVFLNQINVGNYHNMRDLNKKIKRVFVDYISKRAIDEGKAEIAEPSQRRSILRKIADVIS